MVLSDEVIDQDRFVEIAKISRVTAQRMRRYGNGPRFIRLGGGQIRYMLSDVLAWLEAKLVEKLPELTDEQRAERKVRGAKAAATRRANAAAKKAGG